VIADFISLQELLNNAAIGLMLMVLGNACAQSYLTLVRVRRSRK